MEDIVQKSEMGKENPRLQTDSKKRKRQSKVTNIYVRTKDIG